MVNVVTRANGPFSSMPPLNKAGGAVPVVEHGIPRRRALQSEVAHPSLRNSEHRDQQASLAMGFDAYHVDGRAVWSPSSQVMVDLTPSP